MFNIFKTPWIKTDNYQELSKHILTHKGLVLSFFVFLILFLLSFNTYGTTFWISLIGIFATSFCMYLMHSKKVHYNIAKTIVITSSVLIQYNIFSNANIDHLLDATWLFIVMLYGFYTINIKWGIYTVIFNFIGLISFQFLQLTYRTDTYYDYSFNTKVEYYAGLVFGAIVLTSLLVHFHRTQKFAKNRYKRTNHKLSQKNVIVLQQNHEKTVMLKEIHHRVKNNLQIVISLLRLQSHNMNDEGTVKQFEEATNRVIAMSLIHEKIYQSKELAKIDISEYFLTLTNDLIKSYSINLPIQTNISSEIKYMTPTAMVPLALLINELISNTLKHGFQAQLEGIISLRLKKISGIIEFDYSDNGLWKKNNEEKSFGLELIDTLTEQLEGKYTRNTNKGTQYFFKFPDNL